MVLSRDMSPPHAQNDSTNGTLADHIHLRDGALRYAPCGKHPNERDIVLGQLGGGIGRTIESGRQHTSPLLSHVTEIVGGSSYEEMAWIAAGWDIAGMADISLPSIFHMRDFPHESVDQAHTSTMPLLPISVLIDGTADPQPTSVLCGETSRLEPFDGHHDRIMEAFACHVLQNTMITRTN